MGWVELERPAGKICENGKTKWEAQKGILESFTLKITGVEVLKRTERYAMTKSEKKGQQAAVTFKNWARHFFLSALRFPFISQYNLPRRKWYDAQSLHLSMASRNLPMVNRCTVFTNKILNSTRFTLDNINPLLSLVVSVLNWLWRYSFSGDWSFCLQVISSGLLSPLFSSHLACFKWSSPRSISQKKKTTKKCALNVIYSSFFKP